MKFMPNVSLFLSTNGVKGAKATHPLERRSSDPAKMPPLQRIEDAPGEVFGLAAVVHHLRLQGVDRIIEAAAECGLSVSRELVEQALAGWELELKSDIDGSCAEPVSHYFEDFDHMGSPTRQCLEAAFRLQPHGRVLDIGCGPGRFLKAFRERSYDTTGLDTSRLIVWLCKQRAVGNVHQMSAEQMSPALGRFDIQLLLGHNLGIGGTPAGVRSLLETHPGRHVGETEFRLEYGTLRTPRFPWIHVKQEEVREWANSAGWDFIELAFDPEEEGHWSGVLRLGD